MTAADRRIGGSADRSLFGSPLGHRIRMASRSGDPSIRQSAGFTLVELLVTLAVLGIASGAVGLAVTALEPPPEVEVVMRLAEARAAAIGTSLPVTVEFPTDVRVTFRPDGSATPMRIHDSTGSWRVDPWTGQVHRD